MVFFLRSTLLTVLYIYITAAQGLILSNTTCPNAYTRNRNENLLHDPEKSDLIELLVILFLINYRMNNLYGDIKRAEKLFYTLQQMIEMQQ